MTGETWGRQQVGELQRRRPTVVLYTDGRFIVVGVGPPLFAAQKINVLRGNDTTAPVQRTGSSTSLCLRCEKNARTYNGVLYSLLQRVNHGRRRLDVRPRPVRAALTVAWRWPKARPADR